MRLRRLLKPLLLLWLSLLLPGLSAEAAESRAIAVIVAPGADPHGLDRQELALIYKRKKRFWDDGRRITPANLPASHPLRRAFSTQVLGHTPEELDDYWRDQYFHGELPPFVASSEEAVIRFVATTPGAIGYVPECLADKRVSVVMVLGEGGSCPK